MLEFQGKDDINRKSFKIKCKYNNGPSTTRLNIIIDNEINTNRERAVLRV